MNLTLEADYFPFGGTQVISNADSLTVNYEFTGYEYDFELHDNYADFREQSPVLGRFFSPDPLGGDPANPQSLNRYAYVLNNPTNGIDPFGLATCLGPGGVTYECERPAPNAPDGPGPGCGSDDDTNSTDCPSIPTIPSNPRGPIQTGDPGSSGGSSGAGNAPPAPSNFVRMPLPANHLNCTTSSGVSFPAPPGFSVSNIAANGATNGLRGAGAAVGQGGYYDFQRFQVGSVTQFFSGYTPVANVAVGAYVQGTGAPQWIASLISNTYAFFQSSNGATAQQAQFRNLGFSLAAGKGTYTCRPSKP